MDSANVDEAIARRRDNSGVNDRGEEKWPSLSLLRGQGRERIFAISLPRIMATVYLLSYPALPTRSLSRAENRISRV